MSTATGIRRWVFSVSLGVLFVFLGVLASSSSAKAESFEMQMTDGQINLGFAFIGADILPSSATLPTVPPTPIPDLWEARLQTDPAPGGCLNNLPAPCGPNPSKATVLGDNASGVVTIAQNDFRFPIMAVPSPLDGSPVPITVASTGQVSGSFNAATGDLSLAGPVEVRVLTGLSTDPLGEYCALPLAGLTLSTTGNASFPGDPFVGGLGGAGALTGTFNIVDDSTPVGGAECSTVNTAAKGAGSILLISGDPSIPNTLIDSGPTGMITTNEATFEFSGDPAGITAKIRCRIDSEPYADCTSPKTFTGLATGQQTVSFRAENAAGGQDPTPATRTFVVNQPPVCVDRNFDVETGQDLVLPVTTGCTDDGPPGLFGSIVTGPANGTIEVGPNFEAVYRSNDGYTGPDSFTYRAYDGTSYSNVATVFVNVTAADPTIPNTVIDSGPTGTINTNEATFEFSGDPVGITAKIQCKVDSGAYADCTSPKTFTGLSAGSHTMSFRAENAQGGQDQSPATRTFTVSIPPVCVDRQYSVETGQDLVLPVTNGCTDADNGPFPMSGFIASNPSNGTISPGPNGEAVYRSNNGYVGPDSFTYQAYDGSDFSNIATVTIDVTAIPDTTPPDTIIDSGPSGTIAVNEATFTFNGDPAGDTSKIQCKLDSGAFADCTSPKTFSGLSDGSHTVSFRAEDATGNQDPTPASRMFTVDTTPPTIGITSGPSGTSNSASAVFAFAADENGVDFECEIDGSGFAAMQLAEVLRIPGRGSSHIQGPGDGSGG